MLERYASAQQAREPQPDIAAIRVAECRRRPPQPSAPWADGTSVGFRCTRCGASPRFRPQNCGALNQTLGVTGMIPNYYDFTTDSAFKATGRRPSEGALVTSNWRGCVQAGPLDRDKDCVNDCGPQNCERNAPRICWHTIRCGPLRGRDPTSNGRPQRRCARGQTRTLEGPVSGSGAAGTSNSTNVRLTRRKSTLFQWLAVSLWVPTGKE